MRLEKKVALITGSGSNIGRSMARIFAGEGAQVMVNDINDEGGAETVALIQKSGGEARYVHADISTSAGVRHAVAFTAQTYGKVDIYLSNANAGNGGTIQEFDRAGTEQVLAVNLLALLEGAHHCLPEMKKAGEGAIVCTSSVQALLGVQSPAYSAAKAALLGAVRTMAVELWPHKIRVNAICPGGGGRPGMGGSRPARRRVPARIRRAFRPRIAPPAHAGFGRSNSHCARGTVPGFGGSPLCDRTASHRRRRAVHDTLRSHSGPPPVETPAAARAYQERLQQEFKAWVEENETEPRQ